MEIDVKYVIFEIKPHSKFSGYSNKEQDFILKPLDIDFNKHDSLISATNFIQVNEKKISKILIFKNSLTILPIIKI